MQITTRHTFLFSIFMHGIFLILICLQWFFSSPVIMEGKRVEHSIQSYVFQDSQYLVVQKPIVKAQADIALKQNKSAPVKQTEKKIMSTSSLSSAKKTVEVNELFSLLHAAIQHAQYYPDSALEMGRTGIAKVEFTLQPNGEIREIHLLQTSGTASLDQAALAAVKAVSPFKMAGNYLKINKIFNIDVVFQVG